jgi:hypothetical protein
MKSVYYLALLIIMFAKPLHSQVPAITHVSCVGSTNGSIKTTMPAGASYTYTWQPGGQNTSSITSQGVGTYTVKVTRMVQPFPIATFTYNIGYKVKWQLLALGHTTSTNGDTLKNTVAATAWTRTSEAANEIPASTAGWIEYVVTTTAHNKGFGFADVGSPSGWNNVDYGFQLSAGGNMIANDNITMTTSTLGTYIVGDVLRIERIGSVVNFKKNNVVFWTRSISAGMAAAVLKIRASLYDATSRLENLGCSAAANRADAGLPKVLTCSSPTAVLTGSSSVSGVTYSWSPVVASTSTLGVSAPNTYTLKVTDPFYGCVVYSTVAVSINTVLPNISSVANKTLTCTNPTAVLSGTSTTSGVTYSWPPTSIITTTRIVSSGGTYTFNVTNPVNGCSASTTASVSNNIAYPTISTTANPSITCTNPVAVLSGTSTIPGVTYSWSPGGALTPSISVSTTGSYILKITNQANGCTSTNTVVVTYTCTEIPNYFVPKKTLGSGYYTAYNKVIYFAFEEEYFDTAQGTANSLKYTIVNDLNDPITSVPGLVEVIGDNRFSINLTTVSGLSPGEFYRIAITNKKNEVFYARFKY